MTNPTDRELNAVLAGVAGADKVEKRQILFTDYIVMEKEVDCYVTKGGQYICDVESWAPLHDANQMERVEEAVAKTMDIEYTKYIESKIWGVAVWNAKRQFDGADVSRKRAFALAVYAMGQAQKGTV